jgi:hypothetical protein
MELLRIEIDKHWEQLFKKKQPQKELFDPSDLIENKLI